MWDEQSSEWVIPGEPNQSWWTEHLLDMTGWRPKWLDKAKTVNRRLRHQSEDHQRMINSERSSLTWSPEHNKAEPNCCKSHCRRQYGEGECRHLYYYYPEATTNPSDAWLRHICKRACKGSIVNVTNHIELGWYWCKNRRCTDCKILLESQLEK